MDSSNSFHANLEVKYNLNYEKFAPSFYHILALGSNFKTFHSMYQYTL